MTVSLDALLSEIDLARDRLERAGALSRPCERVGADMKPVLDMEVPRVRLSLESLQTALEDLMASGRVLESEFSAAEANGQSLEANLTMLSDAMASWDEDSDEAGSAAVAAWLRSVAGEGLAYCRAAESIARSIPRGDRRRKADPDYKGPERRVFAPTRRSRER